MEQSTLEILPSLNTQALKEKANEYAMKGALKAMEEYYIGYNSPYLKAIREHLDNKGTSIHLDIPDIIGVLNESISAEFDKIANTAVAKTFIPLVSQILTREEKEIPFSDILREVISLYEYKKIYPEEFSCSIEERPEYGWLDIKIKSPDHSYNFTLHKDRNSEKSGLKKYLLLTLPYSGSGERAKKMTVKIENASLELPFVPDVLKDEVIAKLARLIISNTLITIDQDDFTDDLFPERCHCD